MQRIPMTPRGYELLVEDLRLHREVLRPENVRAIEEARAHGDISENSEFEAAKERQAMIQAKISDLDRRISMAEVIDVTRLPHSDRVVFGATVTVLDMGSNDELRFQIVGDHEGDVKQGRISVTSPIGRSLMAKTVGDEVRVQTPKGVREFEILKVEHI